MFSSPVAGCFVPMRKILLILVICLLPGQSGCAKKDASGASGGSQSASVDKSLIGSSGDRTQSQLDARAHLEQGKNLSKKDRDEEAAAEFLQATTLDPELAEGYFRLGLTYDALGERNRAEEVYKKAVESYKKFLTNNQKDAEAYYDLGQTYSNLHRYEDAVREYHRAIHLKPDDADIYYDLGIANTRLAQYVEAVGALAKCVELDPGNYRAVDALEEAREGVKRVQTAKKYQEDQLKKEQDEQDKQGEESKSSPSNSNRTRKSW